MRSRYAWVVAAAMVMGCGSSQGTKEATVHEESASAMRADAKAAEQGAQRAAAGEAGERIAGLPEGWELVPKVTYTAKQEAGEVTITAKGENPTAGYETKLVQSMLRIWPPQYLLGRKKPDGPAAQVITPFEVSGSFKAKEPVKAVRVTDGAGKHEVKVGG